MAGINYKKIASDCAKIIKENGAVMQFNIRGAGTYDPAKGITPEIKTINANAVLCQPTNDDEDGTEEISAYLLVENAGNFTNAASVIIDGAEMEITKVYPIRPNVVTICAWKIWMKA